MRPTWRLVPLATLIASAGAWGVGPLTAAQETPAVVKSARGGLLARTKEHQFEVFFFPSGVRVFPYAPDGTPRDASQLTGTVTFYHPGSSQPWFARPLRPAAGKPSPSLDLAIGLGNVPARGVNVAFEIAGLADSAGPKTTFTVPFAFVGATAPQPAPTPTDVPTVPRYVYGPGYYGYGYYQYTAPGTVAPTQQPSAGTYGVPSWYGGSRSGAPAWRDWTTGGHAPNALLGKPWLRPID